MQIFYPLPFDDDFTVADQSSEGPFNEIYGQPSRIEEISEELLRLMALPSELANEGTIDTIVIRPQGESGERCMVKAARVTQTGLESLDQQIQDHNEVESSALTLIRSDVANVLMQANPDKRPITGHNLHVKGLDISREKAKTISCIAIYDPRNTKTPKVVLVKVEENPEAGELLVKRVGKTANAFLRKTAPYTKGLEKYKGQLLDPHHQALLGLKLGVLKGGTIGIGDKVKIINDMHALQCLMEQDTSNEMSDRLDFFFPPLEDSI